MNKLTASDVVRELAAMADMWASTLAAECQADDILELHTAIGNYIGRAVAVNRAAEELLAGTKAYYSGKAAKVRAGPASKPTPSGG